MELHLSTLSTLGQKPVWDENGNRMQLGACWQKSRAVIIFVRHFGWIFSRRQVAELAEHDHDFAERHARLIVVGNGEPKRIKSFRKVTGYRGRIYTDPTLDTYRTLNFKSGIGSLIGIKSLAEGIRAFHKGHTQQGIQGSALQQGGALVVGPGDCVHYFYRSREPGDFPPIEALLKACKG